MLRQIPPIRVFVLWLIVLFGVTFFSDNVFYRSQKNSLDTIPNDLTEKKTHETQQAKLEPDPVTAKGLLPVAITKSSGFFCCNIFHIAVT